MSESNIKEISSLNDFTNKVLNIKEKPVLVDFWAEWCGPCKSLMPFIEKFSVEYKDRLDFYKINTDTNDWIVDLSLSDPIRALPTIILFKNGVEFTRVVGADINKVLNSIKEVLNS